MNDQLPEDRPLVRRPAVKVGPLIRLRKEIVDKLTPRLVLDSPESQAFGTRLEKVSDAALLEMAADFLADHVARQPGGQTGLPMFDEHYTEERHQAGLELQDALEAWRQAARPKRISSADDDIPLMPPRPTAGEPE